MKNLSPLHIVTIFVLLSLLWLSGINLLVSRNTSGDPFFLERILDGIYILLAAVLIFFLVRTSNRHLQEKERKYRELFENNPQPIWVYQPQTLRFLDVNQAAVDFYGYSRRELLEMTKNDLLPSGNNAYPADEVSSDKTLAKGKNYTQLQKKDHALVYVELARRELVFEGEKAIMELSNDLTQRIHTEIKLKHQEEFLQQIFERTPTGICITDESGYFEQVNSAYCRIYGYAEEELRGKHFSLILPPENRSALRHQLRQFLKNQVLQDQGWQEWNVINKHHDKLVVLADIISVKGINHTNKFVTFVTDITERKEAEEKIKQSELALREAQTLAKLGSWEYWLQPPRIAWSDEVFTIHGIDKARGEPTLEELQLLYHPDDLPTFQQLLYQAIDKGIAYNHDIRILIPETKMYKYVNIIGKPEFSAEGNLLKLHGTVIDINERKLAEKHLQEQNQALTKINTELDRFVYSAGHDLRAPLVSILGLINIAQLSSDPAQKDEYMNLMTRSIHKLDNFIRDIIDFSRNARTEVNSEPVAFREIISEITENLTYLAGTRQIETIITIQEEVLFYSDSKRISIIFNNLISNAFRYSDPFKENPQIQIEITTTEKEALIRITDNGIGIAEAHVDKIFQMFYRATESRSGSGLGLFIVKETVATLAGGITVESILGQGTTFRIMLPNRLVTTPKDTTQSAVNPYAQA